MTNDSTFDGFRVGDRVELHPSTDRWMQGDRYGEVVKIGHTYVHVHMDRSNKTIRVRPQNLLHVGRSA